MLYKTLVIILGISFQENFIRKIQKYPNDTLISRKRIALEKKEFTSKKIKPTTVNGVINTTATTTTTTTPPPPPLGESDVNKGAANTNMTGDYVSSHQEKTHENNNNDTLVYRKLLLEYRYPLNNCLNKWISVGVNPLQNFQVVVNISSSKMPNGIKFTALEWREFLVCRSIIESHLSGFSNIESYTLTRHKLLFHSFEDTSVVVIELENDRICLTEASLNTIYYLMELIKHNVVFLESVNFCNYYKNIVTEALTSAGDIFSNISRSINDFSSLPNLAMREILLYYTDIIFDSIVNTNVENTLHY